MKQCERCDIRHLANKRRVCIPPPLDKIRGCLISRDPTSEFLDKLEEYKQLSTDKKRILWFDAPPIWLCKKIKKIMNFDDNSPDMKKIQDFLNCECYWTHLHKCPTKPQKNKGSGQDETNGRDEDYKPYLYPRAKLCANGWFESEFDKYDLKDKIIITLGSDVQFFFKRWSKDNGIENSKKIIRLPHPSGRCRSWNPNADHTEIIKQITWLLDLLDAE